MLFKNKRIFIVEDQATYVAIAATYLRFEGAEVEFEGCGPNVVEEMLNRLPIDLILMDLVLTPSMNGFDLFDQIRAIPKLAHIPVVAMSSADPETAIPKAKEKGFSGFISKPISPAINHYVAAVLNGEQIWKTDSWRYWMKGPSK